LRKVNGDDGCPLTFGNFAVPLSPRTAGSSSISAADPTRAVEARYEARIVDGNNFMMTVGEQFANATAGIYGTSQLSAGAEVLQVRRRY